VLADGSTNNASGVQPEAEKMIPDLPWEQRSDWINVKTDVTPAAKGDGIADDTEALQAAFKMIDWNSKSKTHTIYLPAGTYRITRTLFLGGAQGKGGVFGGMIIGNGRSTRIVWDGETGGVMIKDLGFMMGCHTGYILDGRGKAATGLLHAGLMFETNMLYRHMAFRNLTGEGISMGRKHEGNCESSEAVYDNCLFEHCGIGVDLVEYNDYDITFTACEFRDCGQGIVNTCGNIYVFDSHFERSTVRDILSDGGQGSTVRRCTSLVSKLFLEYFDSVCPIVIQDCRIDGWSDRRGAILLNGAPVALFDCVIGNPATKLLPEALRSRCPIWPVRIVGKETQRLIISDNFITVKGKLEPLSRKNILSGNALGFDGGRVYEIPAGERHGSLSSATQSFLKTSVPMPGKIFDAKRDFGAKGDGLTDDTAAIQKTIDAARAQGRDALAFLPVGTYRITNTLEVTGANYRLGGNGLRSAITWAGAPGGTSVHVADPDHVTIEHLSIGFDTNTKNENDILQTSSGTKPSAVCYDRIFVFNPVYNQITWGGEDLSRKRGLRLEGLKKDDTVLVRYIHGNFHCVDSAAATILCNASFNTGHIVVEGKGKDRGGFLGFLVKLGVCENTTLTVQDSHSLVISALYMESDYNCIRLEGAAGDPAGRITIQGAKAQCEKTAFAGNNYHGEFTLGPDMLFLMNPAKFECQGDNPLEIVFLGLYAYAADPVLKIGSNVKLHCVGNEGSDGKTVGYDCPPSIMDTDLKAAIPQISRSFDDLRKLGELDLKLNHANGSKTNE